MFADRAGAGRRLAALLGGYAGDPNAIVLGIPRGGVVVAEQVALALGLPLDIVVAAKVGAPGNPEFAAGAVAADGVLLANPSARMTAEQVEQIAAEARQKVLRYTSALRGGGRAPELAGHTAIVVDDGLATGLTAEAAVGYLRRQGVGRIVLAVPVASSSAAARLRSLADEFVAADVPAFFSAVGQFYAHFSQTNDAEVVDILRAARERARWQG